MRRRDYLKTTGGIATASVLGLAGCLGGAGTGTLAVRVSDQPGDIGDFETCVVYVTGVRLQPADGEPIEEEIEETPADLVELQGEASELVGEVDAPAGEYEFVQLEIERTEATLEGGEEARVTVPGDAPLKFERFTIDGERRDSFELREGERTTFTADFTPVRQGQSGGYVLQPVADETTASYEGGDGGDSGE